MLAVLVFVCSESSVMGVLPQRQVCTLVNPRVSELYVLTPSDTLKELVLFRSLELEHLRSLKSSSVLNYYHSFDGFEKKLRDLERNESLILEIIGCEFNSFELLEMLDFAWRIDCETVIKSVRFNDDIENKIREKSRQERRFCREDIIRMLYHTECRFYYSSLGSINMSLADFEKKLKEEGFEFRQAL